LRCRSNYGAAQFRIAWPTVSATRERSTVISNTIFVGNLNYETTESELEGLFSEVGEVKNVHVPADRMTGRPRGFAFVEFADGAAAQEAVSRFDQHELGGRKLRINEAEDRARRSPGAAPYNSGPSYGGGGGGGGGGGAKGKAGRPKGSRRGMRGKKRSL
jgi:cold-inducible RNA-binding protein